MISNSFQMVQKNATARIVNQINKAMNPKIESLTKGDKVYNDPANGTSGTIYTVKYYNGNELDFRKHNSKVAHRYAIKPKYPPRKKETLPFSPVIYLGLPRLFPFGEYDNEENINKIQNSLPEQYKMELCNLYKELTRITIDSLTSQSMGTLKKRSDFSTTQKGIDSNTISSGEDNIMIILTALMSLKFYYETNTKDDGIASSILLIDEFDATLHPSLQWRLIDLLRNYSNLYKIQVFLTTHSLSLLEHSMEKKDNTIYLVDNHDNIHLLEEPNIVKIKMRLNTQLRDQIYLNVRIPIFTEDQEARDFCEVLLDVLANKDEKFARIVNLFHFVDMNIGAEQLQKMFQDKYLISQTMGAFCILDGDKSVNLSDHTIVLPGKVSPEELIKNYVENLYQNPNTIFWNSYDIQHLGYTKDYYVQTIQPDIQSIEDKLSRLEAENKTAKGVKREENKKLYKKHATFFKILFKDWALNAENQIELNNFYKNLHIMFRKIAPVHAISTQDWQYNENQ